MSNLNLTDYPPPFAAFLREERIAPLGPGTPHPDARAQMDVLKIETAFAPHQVQDADMANACFAGLWLYLDCFDEAHAISQDIKTPTGSYWHGILHRREPDPSNAAYWFRRVGEHPIFSKLSKDAQQAGLRRNSPRWDPFAFIDLCEVHRGTGTPQEFLLRLVQLKEWELLFDWSFRGAIGRR